MKSRVIYAVALAAVVFAANAASAEITTVPPGLNAGDQYRLVFITNDKTTALSSNIADYDAFVTSQANSSTLLASLLTNWRVIGSTSAVSAKTHTSTDDSPVGANGVPIYRLDGLLIASSYDDLWDGSIQNPLYVAQDGTVLDTCCGTWTGTNVFGIGIPGDELGAPDLDVVDGAPNGIASNWIQTSPYPAGQSQYLYGISDVLTVPGEIEIDIRPGKSTNCNGVIPVAVLGSATLDVTQIDPATLTFEDMDVRVKGNGEQSCNFKDINRDGYVDLVCQYQDILTDGTLVGRLLDGTSIKGSDAFCLAN
jgi:hypothetical protein